MKLVPVFTFLLIYTVLRAMIINEASDNPLFEFPTLDTPDTTFRDLSAGCSGFVDCIEYVGAVLENIGKGIIYIVTFLINLLIYIFEIFALILNINFTGFPEAPWWINTIFSTPILAILALITYVIARRGRAQDA